MHNSPVIRVDVEKRPGHQGEAEALKRQLTDFVGVSGIRSVRLINRYDVEGMSREQVSQALPIAFSEPMVDVLPTDLDLGDAFVVAITALPGQFDQRADSLAQCLALTFLCDKPLVRYTRLVIADGSLSDKDKDKVKRFLINPVENEETSLDLPSTLAWQVEKPQPIKTVESFRRWDEKRLVAEVQERGLAMDAQDLLHCQKHFNDIGRDPTETELTVLDTYWSDHCRHTTFLTEITDFKTEDPLLAAAWQDYLALRGKLGVKKPACLMDIATIAVKALKAEGKLKELDESDEINACTIKMDVDGEPWLLLFKNETHNHPTEIEPYGGASTCLGGAIRDPLSGRGYVYQAMRVTGSGDPRAKMADTWEGKLPQLQITTGAAQGYSAYGNQIGLATGQVKEWYHPGYQAKRLEIGAVVGAVPQDWVRREHLSPGDVVVLVGGATGRDGIGGATGSSREHTVESTRLCAAQVQKGNAPEERKLQRLFRNPEALRCIKKCNDFGAGGISVAIGEMADALDIDLDSVPLKYAGLNATEIAVSESQERMAVGMEAKDVARFVELAASENLVAVPVAVVTGDGRLVMRWQGQTVVDLSRAFIDTNGAPRDTKATGEKSLDSVDVNRFTNMLDMVKDLNMGDCRGLTERFDSTIGARSVLLPYGGKELSTPAQAMVATLPTKDRDTLRASAMAHSMDPYHTERSPFHGAYDAVLHSVAKLVATGAGWRDSYLSLQEYFRRMQTDSDWGQPVSALLGALRAQLDLGLAAIGGKDSMSGTYHDKHVPPTVCAFAVTPCDALSIVSPEFKKVGSAVRYLKLERDAQGLPQKEALTRHLDALDQLVKAGKVRAAYALGAGGVAEALFLMCRGNALGFKADAALAQLGMYQRDYGSFLVETDEPVGIVIGTVTQEPVISVPDGDYALSDLSAAYEGRLEAVFAQKAAPAPQAKEALGDFDQRSVVKPAIQVARPKVVIPVFPGTNCEYDTARAFEQAGAQADVIVLKTFDKASLLDSATALAAAIDQAQMLFLPGGFSGGDEPDGSGKFIASFLRNPAIAEAITRLLDERLGLVGGICNGFQALIKLGLLPYGRITTPRADQPTLAHNLIGRHQSRMVRVRVRSVLSPFMQAHEVGDIHWIPISHGEGRLVGDEAELVSLAQKGQILTQYVDEDGKASLDIAHNPNGSFMAAESLCSEDGRVFGRMAHAERYGEGLYRNVPQPGGAEMMFTGAVRYFR